jgi:pyruvate kinase
MKLDLHEEKHRDRKTKIICTIGPSTWDDAGIRELLMRGMNCMRLNFSHGTHEQKADIIGRTRAILASIRDDGVIDFSDGSLENVCAIAADTKGPEIRTGLFKDEMEFNILGPTMDSEKKQKPGMTVRLETNPAVAGTMGMKEEVLSVFVDYRNLHEEVTPGQRIYIDDGLVSLDVMKVDRQQQAVICVANNNAVLGQQKGVNIPGFSLNLPAVTPQDQEDLKFAAEQGVDGTCTPPRSNLLPVLHHHSTSLAP